MAFILNTSWLINSEIIKLIKQKNKDFKNVHIIYGNGMLADIERCDWQDHLAIDNEIADEVLDISSLQIFLQLLQDLLSYRKKLNYHIFGALSM